MPAVVMFGLHQHSDRAPEAHGLTELVRSDCIYEGIVHDKDAGRPGTAIGQRFLGSSAAFVEDEKAASGKLVFHAEPCGTEISAKKNLCELRH